jgi:hypothetical protein
MEVPMAMGRPKAVLVLDAELREQLESLANSRSLPAGLVRRAKIILLSASGKTNVEIARQLETSKVTVSLWRCRFLRQGVSGLYDELRPGRPRPISDERVAQLVRKTLKTKLKAGTHWSIRHRPVVALSFDDGPHPTFTLRVLDILQQHDAKATFFLIGERAVHHPEVVSHIKAAGHEVGNHYFRNCPTLGHSDADFVGYLEQTEKAIGIIAGPKLFRPPGGVAWPRQLRLARAHGYKCVLGCAYPHDPIRPPVWYMRWLVGKNLVLLTESTGSIGSIKVYCEVAAIEGAQTAAAAS